MFEEISPASFYGKKKNKIHILSCISNPHDSDLENIDIDDDDDSDEEINLQVSHNNLLDDYEECESSDEDDADSEYCLPLSELAKKLGQQTNFNNNKDSQEIWYPEKDNELSANPPQFLGNNKINITGDTPYQFFLQLFPEELFQLITTETIRYAVQSGKHSFTVSIDEIKQFFGINIIMTYIKYPAYRMYWSSIAGLGLGIIANTMALKRYEEIKRYLHFINNDEIQNNNKDSFVKVRPFLNILAETFSSAATPSQYLAIDEMIIPFKGRNRSKQYIKSKPKKWGFKVWVRASADGYVGTFEMYQSSNSKEKTELGVIGDTVSRLCKGIEGVNHKMFLDNLFTSVPLLLNLKEKAIYVVGTLRANRLQGASEKLVDIKTLQKQERGSSSITTSSSNISILRWTDNKIVHVISSFSGKEPQDTVKRWDRKKKIHIEIPRPQAIKQYNRFMGGVDMADKMVAHYPHGTKSKKFYMRIVFHFMNVAIINAWILYKKQKNANIPLLEFKAAVATTMITVADNKRKRGRPSQTQNERVAKKKAWTKVIPEIRTDGTGHYPEKMEHRNPPRCHEKSCKRRTRYACKKCKESVCPECMEAFHS